MKKTFLYFTLFILFLIIISFKLSYAEQQLPSGSTVFFISEIILYPVDDYTYTKQNIGLFGDKNYLNIFWDARYNPPSRDFMGVICWLNCPYTEGEGDIEQVCSSYQSCVYEGPDGPGACAITEPKYNYTSPNQVVCKFYDLYNPSIEYHPYPNRTFKIFDFGIQAAGGSFTVGKSVEWPIKVISYSFLDSNYTVNVSTSSQYLSIQNNVNTTRKISYGEVGTVYPKLTFRTLIQSTIKVLIRPTEDPLVCSVDSDCPEAIYGTTRRCVDGKCWREIDLHVKSGYASMPEYGIAGVIQIILLSSLIFYLMVRNGSARN